MKRLFCFAIMLVFVWRSFYAMRIHSGRESDTKTPAATEAKPAE